MGDVLSLIEEVEQKVDKDKAEKLAKKIKKGKGFDLEDFRDQLQQMKNMGGMAGLLDKMPGMGGMAQAASSAGAEKNFNQMECIINSMTPKERALPDSLNGSRKRRIAAGSGTQIQDINRFDQTAQTNGKDDEEDVRQGWHAKNDARFARDKCHRAWVVEQAECRQECPPICPEVCPD